MTATVVVDVDVEDLVDGTVDEQVEVTGRVRALSGLDDERRLEERSHRQHCLLADQHVQQPLGLRLTQDDRHECRGVDDDHVGRPSGP